ncbi:Mss4-like protein, partial [Lineolata rhizophorae]
DSTTTVRGSCLCRRTSFTIPLPTSYVPQAKHLCHCNVCRRTSGTLFTSYLTLPSDPSTTPPSGLDLALLTPYTSSTLTRYFCPTCGTHVAVRGHTDGALLVCAGTLERTQGVVKIVGHEWIEDSRDGGGSVWLPSLGPDRVPAERWLRDPGTSPQAPLEWRDSVAGPGAARTDEHLPEDTLPARCHCGGVQFRIKRPSERSARSAAAAAAPFPDLLVPYHSGASAANPDSEAWWLTGPDLSRFLAGTCACRSCRLALGFDVAAWAFVPAADIVLPDGGAFRREFGAVKTYGSSEGVTRGFCGTCGAGVYWSGDWREELVDVAVGLLDAPEGVRAEDWLGWERGRVSFGEEGRERDVVEALERGL